MSSAYNRWNRYRGFSWKFSCNEGKLLNRGSILGRVQSFVLFLTSGRVVTHKYKIGEIESRLPLGPKCSEGEANPCLQCVKVKKSYYGPGQALRFPGDWGFQISRQWTHEGGKVSPTHRPPLPPRKYYWCSYLIEAELTPGQSYMCKDVKYGWRCTSIALCIFMLCCFRKHRDVFCSVENLVDHPTDNFKAKLESCSRPDGSTPIRSEPHTALACSVHFLSLHPVCVRFVSLR